MSHLSPSTSSLQSTEEMSQDTTCGESQRQTRSPMGNSPHTASIHILDDYSLLNIFYIYRPAIFDGDEGYFDLIQGGRIWDRERWWHKLVHVCHRWRTLIFGSTRYLGLCLVCTYSTPVANMLGHSPPLPLVIDFFNAKRDITADEEGIMFALRQRDRVSRIRLRMSASKLQKLAMAIDEEYPILEYLIMRPLKVDKSSALILPEALQAPRLRHLMLRGFVLPIRSQLLTNCASIATLSLCITHRDAYFQPNTLLRWISFMPQLETLVIDFSISTPNRDVDRQLWNTSLIKHVTLPNLRFLVLQSGSAYVEAVVRWITAPRLKKLDIWFFKQLTFSVPCLRKFISTTTNLRFDSAKFEFCKDKVYAGVFLREEVELAQVKMIPLLIIVHCWHLDWQVSSVAQIFHSLNQIFTAVEHLTLEHRVHDRSSEEHNEVDRAEWRKLLMSFSKVKTLRIGDGLIKEVSRSLRLDDGEVPLELLPELQSLTYSEIDSTGDAFTPFIDARQNAGHPVTVVHPNPRPVTPEIWDW